jgi:hypothetical protein
MFGDKYTHKRIMQAVYNCQNVTRFRHYCGTLKK